MEWNIDSKLNIARHISGFEMAFELRNGEIVELRPIQVPKHLSPVQVCQLIRESKSAIESTARTEDRGHYYGGRSAPAHTPKVVVKRKRTLVLNNETN